MRRYRPSVGDPVGAAGDCEGMRTDRSHVFVKPGSPVGESRRANRRDCDDFLWKFSDQMGEKRSGGFRRNVNDLGIDVFRDLFDGEEHLKATPKAS